MMERRCCSCHNLLEEVDCVQQQTSHGLCKACALELAHEDQKSETFLQFLSQRLRVILSTQAS